MTMNHVLAILIVVVSVQGLHAQATVPAADLGKVGWLEGTWVRTNLKPGRTGTESWKKLSPTAWHGLGCTLREKDTVFVERMKLVIYENTPAFVADVPENKGLVYFKFTAATSHSFTCENPAHDYPKKIVYDRQGNNLKVTISGDGKSNEFLFTKE